MGAFPNPLFSEEGQRPTECLNPLYIVSFQSEKTRLHARLSLSKKCKKSVILSLFFTIGLKDGQEVQKGKMSVTFRTCSRGVSRFFPWLHRCFSSWYMPSELWHTMPNAGSFITPFPHLTQLLDGINVCIIGRATLFCTELKRIPHPF